MKVFSLFCGLLTVFFACLLLPVAAESAKPAVVARTVAFQIVTECNCASCVFDVQRSIKKFEGVKSAKFNGRQHRLEIEFTEGTKPISELAQMLEKSDLGKGAALCWNLPQSADAKAQTQAFSQVSGVKNVRMDAKTGLILLNFQATPAVTLKQLDAAAQGEVNANR